MRMLLAVLLLSVSGAVSAEDPIYDPTESVIDRVNGTYSLLCQGVRTDGGSEVVDWTLRKDMMGYLPFGVLSHYVINAVNEAYLNIGDAAVKQMGILSGGIPVPGMNAEE